MLSHLSSLMDLFCFVCLPHHCSSCAATRGLSQRSQGSPGSATVCAASDHFPRNHFLFLWNTLSGFKKSFSSQLFHEPLFLPRSFHTRKSYTSLGQHQDTGEGGTTIFSSVKGRVRVCLTISDEQPSLPTRSTSKVGLGSLCGHHS